MKDVIDDYDRKIKAINELLNENNSDETVKRLKIKAGCYRSFIVDIKRSLSDSDNEVISFSRFLKRTNFKKQIMEIIKKDEQDKEKTVIDIFNLLNTLNLQTLRAFRTYYAEEYGETLVRGVEDDFLKFIHN